TDTAPASSGAPAPGYHAPATPRRTSLPRRAPGPSPRATRPGARRGAATHAGRNRPRPDTAARSRCRARAATHRGACGRRRRGRVIELLGRGRVFQGPDRSDPAGELALRVPAGEMGELEVGVRVDEARDEDGVGELDPAGPGGEGYIRVRPDRGDPAIVRNENGAVRDGRRRDRMDRARTNAEHLGTHGDTPVPN